MADMTGVIFHSSRLRLRKVFNAIAATTLGLGGKAGGNFAAGVFGLP